MIGFALAAMLLPRQHVKVFDYPRDEQGQITNCISAWGSGAENVQNICHYSIVVAVQFKDGQGRKFSLDAFESKEIRQSQVPYRAEACVLGAGEPSESLDKMVRPGFKSKKYACIEVEMNFQVPQVSIVPPGVNPDSVVSPGHIR